MEFQWVMDRLCQAHQSLLDLFFLEHSPFPPFYLIDSNMLFKSQCKSHFPGSWFPDTTRSHLCDVVFLESTHNGIDDTDFLDSYLMMLRTCYSWSWLIILASIIMKCSLFAPLTMSIPVYLMSPYVHALSPSECDLHFRRLLTGCMIFSEFC